MSTASYNAVGNRLQQTVSGAVTNYSYDAANRLTLVTSGTLTTTFQYDGLGNRVAQTVDGVEMRYAAG